MVKIVYKLKLQNESEIYLYCFRIENVTSERFMVAKENDIL